MKTTPPPGARLPRFLLTGAAAFLACAALRAAALPPPLNQPWTKTLTLPALDGEEIVAVRLDSEVYNVTPDSFADLRLVCGGTQEMPYALETVSETATRTVRQNVAGAVVTVQEEASNRLVIVWALAAAERGPVEGFAISTGLRDFERSVDVFAEAADGGWTQVASDVLLFDYSRFMDIRRLEFAVTRSAARRFKFVINDITDTAQSPFTEVTRRTGADGAPGTRDESFRLERRPLRIEGFVAWHSREVDSVKKDTIVDYGSLPCAVAEDAKLKQTVVTVSARREPLTQLRVETATRNFSRGVEVQTPVVDGVRTTWRTVARGVLSSIQFRTYSSRELTIDLPALRASSYRIVIHNGDSPPIAVSAVIARGLSHRLVFLHDGRQACRLVYGASDLPRPVYDTVTVLGAVRRGTRMVEARLGPAEAVTGARAGGGGSWRRWINSPVFFGGAVVLAVAALAAMLYSAVKRAGPVPPDTE
jgi:hypothetical protein